jgi:hypothetical protein
VILSAPRNKLITSTSTVEVHFSSRLFCSYGWHPGERGRIGPCQTWLPRHLTRHAAGVPMLSSAPASKPDWFLTHNTKHFTKAVRLMGGQGSHGRHWGHATYVVSDLLEARKCLHRAGFFRATTSKSLFSDSLNGWNIQLLQGRQLDCASVRIDGRRRRAGSA